MTDEQHSKVKKYVKARQAEMGIDGKRGHWGNYQGARSERSFVNLEKQ